MLHTIAFNQQAETTSCFRVSGTSRDKIGDAIEAHTRIDRTRYQNAGEVIYSMPNLISIARTLWPKN